MKDNPEERGPSPTVRAADENSRPGGEVSPVIENAFRMVATFFGVGYLRPGPGTWASAITMLLWAAFAYRQPSPVRFLFAIVFASSFFVAGIPAATRVARSLGNKDPQIVVIDEVVGQLIALIGAPLTWQSFLAGFILFRIFDIIKPPPIRQLEAIPEGAGIMLDDVAAGFFALICLHLLLHSGLLK
ncbi:MAG TPA: phosphatidylglycerophosphatase A [Candidatus Binatia bacterium]|nr:phosphatidylglycerophosphatase A [Candidatus Binatia bacterium]